MSRVKVLSDSSVYNARQLRNSAEPWKLDPAEQSPPDSLLIADAAQIRGLHPQCFKQALHLFSLSCPHAV